MNSELIRVACAQLGVSENRNVKKHNPVIVSYFNDIGFQWIHDDETPWCSAFVNWVALQVGAERSKLLTARSWLAVGEGVDEPSVGDVAVFWRGARCGAKGHVGFYLNDDEKYVYLLGGNQRNSVCVAPYKKSRLLGYRRLHAVELFVSSNL